MFMKNFNTIFTAALLNLFLWQSTVYAGFFDDVTKGLSEGLQETFTGATKPQQTASKPPPEPAKPTGYANKTTNVRSGPGTSNSKVGTLSQGAQFEVISQQGNWVQVQSDSVTGWVYKPLVTISTAAAASQATSYAANQAKNYPAPQKGPLKKQEIHYAGYSKEFQNVKKMMASGNLKGVEKFFSEREAQVLSKNQSKWESIDEIGLLRWMERGTLYLDEGSLDKSIKSFTNAEDILNVRQQDSRAVDLFKTVSSFTAESIIGKEEFQEYPGEGFEKVLMLNYKSIAYLIEGNRNAYNVARRAINWQNMEKERFRDEIEKAKEEEKKEEKESDAQAGDDWKSNYQKLDKIAASVPSAFVNPFGYYVTGMIQEYESRDDPSLRDNARIAYEKALELNPNSAVIKQAVKDMKGKKPSKSKRLLHLVVGEGFVPEKKMLLYYYTGKGAEDGPVPIKLPIYEPVPSKVARVEVQTTGGKRLARLSEVANIEAICLRHQKDSEALRSLRVILSIARAVSVNKATSSMGLFSDFGNMLNKSVNELSAPDMRSWMSLPARLQAARLYISKNIKTLKIVSYDKNGRRLASKTVKLDPKSDSFVYARSIDNQLYTHDARALWTARN
jgi:hypothetical protein